MSKSIFSNKNILITGGTGSFGSSFVDYLLKIKNNKPKKIIVFSRDELKQYNMAKLYPKSKYPNIRFFIGDVRDKSRLKLAFKNVDYVIHSAALKHVPTAEYNPIEYIKTNIIGAQNIIEASLECNVKNIVALSTDKASSPINLYGATKLCSDKLFISANNLTGTHKIKFSVVRYGNVFASRGSVIPFFVENEKKGVLPVTDKDMTRFNIMMNEAIEAVVFCLKNTQGGEIFVPKTPSYRITDLVKAISSKCKIKVIGIRAGEKIHEELISYHESRKSFDLKKYYIVVNDDLSYSRYLKRGFNKIKKPFVYNSLNNGKYLTISQLKQLISKYKLNRKITS